MDKLYQTQDKIEDTKFLLAALKIETAFLAVFNVADKKIRNHTATFTHLLQLNTTVKTLTAVEKPFLNLATVYSKIVKQKKRGAFQRVWLWCEKEDQKGSIEGKVGSRVRSVGVIQEEELTDLTEEQIEVSCRHYRQKIQEVQRSFSDFIRTIKKE